MTFAEETMLAVWLEQRELRIRPDVAVPRPEPGEALVRVRLAGICSTDSELVRGYYPFTGVLGHEFVGVVGEGPPELVGRRVVGEINAVCGTCADCRAGRGRHCDQRTVLGIVGRDGAFAEWLVLPAANLHLVPDELPDEAAVFTEPLAAALEVLEQVRVGARDRVLVVGDGKLGQLVARVLARTGCELLVVGRHPEKLALLTAAGIATAAGVPSESRRFDVVVEATGNPEGFRTARLAVRPRGTLVLKSTYSGELRLDASSLVVDEITLVGSRCGPFAPALQLLSAGEIDPLPLIHARYPLEQAQRAFEHSEQAGTLKVLLDIGAS